MVNKKNKDFYNKKETNESKFIIAFLLVSFFSSVAMYIFLINPLIVGLQGNLLVVGLIIFAVVMIFGLGLGLFINKITRNNEIDEDGYFDITDKK